MEEIGPHEQKTVLQGYTLSSMYIFVLYSRQIIISMYEAGMLNQTINIIASVVAKTLNREQKIFIKNIFTTAVPSSVPVLC